VVPRAGIEPATLRLGGEVKRLLTLVQKRGYLPLS
jgi:hypothetical protein